MEKSELAKTELSKDQMKILKDAFDAFDIEKKGSISLEVIGTIMELLGYGMSEEELKEVMEDYDEDESGQIEFEEFIELASNYVEPEEDYDVLRAELREVFMMYDKDGTGFIPVNSFKAILRELDGAVPENELDEIVDEIDADSSGTVDFEEFMEVMTGPSE
ncbi:troponin C, isoallergen Bla g 6.0101-like [Anopheles arabiensis]|uniref:AGAP006182-PA n=4 Tax=gambiae species complex TaxID=44542 RepID=Q7PP00_ANOGA|nr:troponin C, isoallergen Bla g 6.0101-like [Anopheles arabiensis]XP_040224520.1 troponin C, isoallergen Bla g 6.0101-like [Anopheles coluzzii]XP_041768313.1 troponin C, isoallergen Bla g 6.0101-like [Anopheles merus]XP_316247.2 troponin C, isoallergen Bla g 6.0101 [Anopheles gambiae]EAA11254.3 AGAP006182-PA [Anopheles gambiae str. PEST]DAA01883.1 TPA_inf: troponin C type IIIb3 [Anopheles gambiae str. PEST]